MKQQTTYLKLAKEEDVPDLLKLSRDLYEESIYSRNTAFAEDQVEATLDMSTSEHDKICTVMLKKEEETIGFITMAASNYHFSNEKMAIELGFWIKPDHRSFSNLRKLVSSYFYWAKKIGCKTAMLGKLKDKHSPEYYIIRRLS